MMEEKTPLPGCEVFALQGQTCSWKAQTLIDNGIAAYAISGDLGCSKSDIQYLESCSSSFLSARTY